MRYGKLFAHESLELVKPVVMQGRREFIEKWLQEDKLECSEELGDMIRPHDNQWAMKIYIKGKSHSKVVAAFLESGQYDKVKSY